MVLEARTTRPRAGRRPARHAILSSMGQVETFWAQFLAATAQFLAATAQFLAATGLPDGLCFGRPVDDDTQLVLECFEKLRP